MRISQHYNLRPLLLLAGIEALAFALAPVVAVMALNPPPASGLVRAFVSLCFGGTVLLGFTAMGLYNQRQRARLPAIVVRSVVAIAAGVAVVALLSYIVPPLLTPRKVLAGAAVIAFILSAIARIGFERLVDQDAFKRRVLIYGTGRRAVGVSQLRRRADQRGFYLVGYAASDDQDEVVMVPTDRIVYTTPNLFDFCRANDVDEVVVAMDDRRRSFPVHDFLECRMNGIAVVEILDFLERETGKVRLDVLNPSWIIFAPGFDQSPWRETSKRLLDVVASALLLIVGWPLMLLALAAIKLEDGWHAPVLYRQQRVGRYSRNFDVLKFRSMRVNAEAPGTAVWAAVADTRVTRIGSFIRKVRIDELPQIFNVLRGDMSLVGPRPERPEFVAQLENRIPYYRERHSVKPGITGWAQLCYPYGSSEQDAAEKLQYDLYYVKNHSLVFDIMIVLQTVEVVLWGQGAR